MIKTFGDKETKRIINEQFSKKFPKTIQKVALRKLIMINNANSLEDLRIPPNNRLEALKGDRKGQHSIRINDQFRICFIFSNSDFYEVSIVDYHKKRKDIIMNTIELPTVGEILSEEFLVPLKISCYRLAKDINVPVSRIQDIIHGRRKITPDTSLRLSKYFGVSERFFLDIQSEIDIRNLKRSLKEEIDKITLCKVA